MGRVATLARCAVTTTWIIDGRSDAGAGFAHQAGAAVVDAFRVIPAGVAHLAVAAVGLALHRRLRDAHGVLAEQVGTAVLHAHRRGTRCITHLARPAGRFAHGRRGSDACLVLALQVAATIVDAGCGHARCVAHLAGAAGRFAHGRGGSDALAVLAQHARPAIVDAGWLLTGCVAHLACTALGCTGRRRGDRRIFGVVIRVATAPHQHSQGQAHQNDWDPHHLVLHVLSSICTPGYVRTSHTGANDVPAGARE